jgi:hypothetical protein
MQNMALPVHLLHGGSFRAFFLNFHRFKDHLITLQFRGTREIF